MTPFSSLRIDDIATMIDIAKRTAGAANASASNTMNRLKDINAEINAIKALNVNGTPDQANINRILSDVDMAGEWKFLHAAFMLNMKRWVCGDECDLLSPRTVKNLSNSIPSLLDKFNQVEKLSSDIDPNNNISYNIMRIKELIEQARSAANRVRSLHTGREAVKNNSTVAQS